jgi:hypothetical protein
MKIIHGMLILVVFLTACSGEENPTTEEAGQAIIDLLQQNDYETIQNDWMTDELKESLSQEEIAEEWEKRTEELEFQGQEDFEIENRTEELDVLETTLDYTEIEFEIRLIFNQERQLAGFSLSEGTWVEVKPESIEEEEITVGAGTDFPLDGMLTLPKEFEDDLPAVVLVHGSGPTDYNESAYAYQPFRDIAWGLAEKGIAVIRYDKRTYAYGEEMRQQNETLTVYEETVEDAIRATELVKGDDRIDESQVFLAGHSLGGMLAPRIEVQGGDYAGLISLAGSPRPLWEIIYDQNIEVINRLITDETEKQEQIEAVEREYEKAQALENHSEEKTQEMEIFGVNGFYFKEMDEYHVPTLLTEINKPTLFLQGEDDFQVFYDKDFLTFQELLGEDDQATLISYPDLNHFFVAYDGPEKGTLAEYEVPGQVETEVIKDMAEWILNQDE